MFKFLSQISRLYQQISLISILFLLLITYMERNDIHMAIGLETVMKTSVLKTMNNPSWPIIYGTVSWKLGCFY